MLGRGSNGTELYVKVEKNNVNEQFPVVGGDRWEPVTLWFGKTRLTENHKLWQNGGHNKYYLAERVGNGLYKLGDKKIYGSNDVEEGLKTKKYKYIELNRNRHSNRWNAWSSFWGDQCRYQRADGKWDETTGLMIRCLDSFKNWNEREKWEKKEFVTLTITKEDYELN